ncbi:MAG: hypothetical protein ACTHJT_02750 [Cytophaga sp.]|uniref:hypothetical protein n=1 Tax=Cytophaga sp. TaxID=29535 RepID=UPI003F7F8892
MSIIPLILLLLIPFSIITSISYGIGKFTNLILEKQNIKHAKLIAIISSLLAAALIIYWLNDLLSGTRFLGC